MRKSRQIMSGFEREVERVQQGFKQIITKIVVGIVYLPILEAFIDAGLVSPSYALLIRLASTIPTLILVFFMPFFGIGYTIGWVFGLALMSSSGLIKPSDYFFYLIPLIIGWLLQFLRR